VRRLWIITSLVISILCLAPNGFASDAVPSQPEWCRSGFVCVPTAYFAERTAIVWELREEVARLKAANRRFGWGCGCGYGPAWALTQDLKIRTLPAFACTLNYGWRAR
jgi:hypothetical protein